MGRSCPGDLSGSVPAFGTEANHHGSPDARQIMRCIPDAEQQQEESFMNTPTQQRRKTRTRDLVLMSLFTAVILLMAFTPLGLIDLPLIKATILHVPVIIGAIVLGPRAGAWFGLVFGLASLAKNTMAPALLSFAFSPLIPVPGAGQGSLWALVICLVPRLLTGILPYYVYRGLRALPGKFPGKQTLPLIAAGLCGALVNTLLVMGLIGTLLADAFAAAKGISLDGVTAGIMAIVLANGVPEAAAAAVLTPAVCLPLQRIFPASCTAASRARPVSV